MDNTLGDSHTFIDLLQRVGRSIVNKDYRAVKIVLNDELSYEVEYTDSRTNRYRYNHLVKGKRDVQSYYHADECVQAINDIMVDARSYFNKFLSAGDASKTEVIVRIYPTGHTLPINYKSQPGALRFDRI